MSRLLVVVILLLSVFGDTALAQETTNQNESTAISQVAVENCDLTQAGEGLTIDCDFKNKDSVQTGIKYTVGISKGDGGSKQIIDEKVYNETFALAPKQSLHKTITYAIPKGIDGEVDVFVRVGNEEGLQFSEAKAGEITHSATGGATLSDCYLTKAGDDTNTKYSLTEGVIVTSLDQLVAHCMVTNKGNFPLTLTPTLVTYKINSFGKEVNAPAIETPMLTIEGGKTTEYLIALPRPSRPDAYSTHVALALSNTPFSNTIAMDYVGEGVSSVVQNITIDKISYAEGDTAEVKTLWVGASLPESSGEVAKSVYVFIVSQGTLCGEKTDAIPNDIKQGGLITTSVSIQKGCAYPVVTTRIIGDKENTLLEKSISVSPDTSETNNSNHPPYIYKILGILGALILVVIIGLMYKRKSKANKGLTALMFLLALPAALLISTNTSFAQEDDGGTILAQVEIQNCNLLQEGSVLNIGCDFTNAGNNPESGVRYAIGLVKVQGETRTPVDQKFYPETLTLSAGRTIRKDIKYEIPPFADGTFEVWIISDNTEGVPLARTKLGTATHTKVQAGVLIEECFVRVENEPSNTIYAPNIGVDITTTEILLGSCQVVNNGVESITVAPTFETFRRNMFGDKVDTPSLDNPTITLEPGVEQTYSFKIPTVKDPQAYDVALTLTKDGVPISNTSPIHYVIQGPSATIQTLTLDKTGYREGETAMVTTFVTGSADSYPGSRAGNTASAIKSYQLSLASGEISCGEITQDAPSSTTSPVAINVPVVENCVNPVLTLRVSDTEGRLLAMRTVMVTTEPSEIPPTSGMDRITTYLMYGGGGLLIILIAIFVFVFLKGRHRTEEIEYTKPQWPLSVLIVLFLLGVSVLLGGAPSADALTFTHLGRNYTVNLDKSNYSPSEAIDVTMSVSYSICTNGSNGGWGIKALNVPTNELYEYRLGAFAGPTGRTTFSETKNTTFTAPGAAGNYQVNYNGGENELIPNSCTGTSTEVVCWGDMFGGGCDVYEIQTGCQYDYNPSGTYNTPYTVSVANGSCSSTVDQCSAGTFASDTDTATEDRWQCVGSSSTANCSLPKSSNGVCGSANNVSVATAPSSGLCDSSGGVTWNDSSGTDGTFNWTCDASGGGTGASCSAPVSGSNVNGACSTTLDQCTAGTFSATPADTSTDDRWSCVGTGTGTTASCSKAKPAPPPPTCGSYHLPLTASCTVAPSIVAPNTNVTFTVNASGGWYDCNGPSGSFSYQWNGTDGLSGTSTQNTKTKSYSTEGSKSASVAAIYSGWGADEYIIVDCPNVNVTSTPKPDLTAGSIETPTSITVDGGWLEPDTIVYTAKAGEQTNLSTTITNSGNANTGAGFTNLFQLATDSNGTGATDIVTANSAALANRMLTWPYWGGEVDVNVQHTFSTAGTYYVRACADKSSSANNGIIVELNETNNCGPWTMIVVAPSSGVSCFGSPANPAGPATVTWSKLGSINNISNYTWTDSIGNYETPYMSPYSVSWTYYNAMPVTATLTMTDYGGGETIVNCSVNVGGAGGPDLTAGTAEVLEVGGDPWEEVDEPTVGVAVDIVSDISNIAYYGDDVTTTFTNLFQKADDVFGTNAVDIGTDGVCDSKTKWPDTLDCEGGGLEAGGGETARITYTFPAGDANKRKYLRACADKSSAASAGTIAEANETNNCGPWFAVDVEPAPVPLSVVSCTPSPNPANISQSVRFDVVTTGGDEALPLLNLQWSVTGGSPSSGSLSYDLSKPPSGGNRNSFFTTTFATAGSYAPRITKPVWATGGPMTPFDCSPVTVGPPSATITAPNCAIPTGSSNCSVNVSWNSTNTGSPRSVRQNGSEFNTAASSAGTSRPLSYGVNTFTFHHNSGAAQLTQLAIDDASAYCIDGVAAWNGTICAAVPVDPGLSLNASPSRIVRAGSIVTVNWTITDPSIAGLACTVTGPGAPSGNLDLTPDGDGQARGNFNTPAVTGRLNYTLNCTASGNTYVETLLIESVGTVEEV